MKDPVQEAILNGFYDQNYQGHELYGPKLLSNNDQEKIWFTLRQELLSAKHFTWAVAFVTRDMLVPFKVVMADLAKQGRSGTLITSDYLNFNDPVVFEELLKIPNLEVKLSQRDGFHAKGYLFDHEDYETLIIGSPNFTRNALLANYEWALKVSTKSNAALTQTIKKQIKELEKDSQPLTKDWIEIYRQNWSRPVAKKEVLVPTKEIRPNQMQAAALKELNGLVKAKEKRGLVVSATGTGKTYLGAFAVKDFKPQKFIYVVHREQIAKKAMESFYQVIGGDRKDYGVLSGHHHDLDKKYLFATVQTLSQENVLAKLDQDSFDYILIDEAHRAAAPSYQKIINYFKPEFLLGMTATPERMDEQDVYQIFDYNLAYEVRLQDALEDKMLAPFHYVGVQDYEQDGEVIDETSNLSRLTAQARVDYVLKELAYYGYCGKQAKGLVFCSRQDEAKELANIFTKKGHPAKALTNQDSEKKRQEVVKQLEVGDLEYIFTVDLFNEGVDIPALNQIVMLRNTQSSIVFIQQLGRGLRKYPGKDYVTVIDFIGNYKNNYLIPLALNNDNSRDKDRTRAEVKLPEVIGVSTINFSKIASEKILASLDQVKLDSMKELRASYKDLKNKIGRIPYLMDFAKYGSTSPTVLIKNKALNSYADFLMKMGERVQLTEYEKQVLSFVTKELALGKRPHELILLKLLLENNQVSRETYLTNLAKNGAYIDDEVIDSIEKILSLAFFDVKAGETTKKEQYGKQALVSFNEDKYELNETIKHSLKNSDFVQLFRDAIEVGLKLNQEYDGQTQFTLYQKYDRKDVCRLLNWPLDVSAPMYGYRVDEKVTPIFITYKKDSDKKRNAIYQNTFEDGRSLRWYTRTPRHLDSDEVKRLLEPKMRLELFVKRSDAAGKDFFYLGPATIQKDSVKEELIGSKKKPAVGMNLRLTTPLASQMYALLLDE
ncbi:DUF3427 domain-containing protein [Lactobacillus sp. PV034]|uniref:DUF3427 domain-containing protein n=1 Tax=Lactobacillus sp. PV034 TaxID=2594495 RepID=UPI00224078D3|nr:DEAD/DEAH box helicase [Lactobacillus sp. PV034]QNQ81111.1 DUF3427 domain-containing protein [Lactobacillus sp. PV034]